MAPRGTRVARILQAMRMHQSNPERPNACRCGYPIKRDDSQMEHTARAIVSSLYGTQNPDERYVGEQRHRGHPDNIALHRAFGEPLCQDCLAWLESGN